ncbi:hypothetical protein WJ972_11505 [Achromobacter insuavis]
MLLLSVCMLAAASLGVLTWRIARRPAGKTPGDMARSAAAGAALFAALGPPVGTLVFALFMAIATISVEALFTSIFLVPWSYLYGGVPALLCGLVAGACRRHRVMALVLLAGVAGRSLRLRFPAGLRGARLHPARTGLSAVPGRPARTDKRRGLRAGVLRQAASPRHRRHLIHACPTLFSNHPMETPMTISLSRLFAALAASLCAGAALAAPATSVATAQASCPP